MDSGIDHKNQKTGNTPKDECPDHRVYGDEKYSNYLEFRIGKKTRKIFFPDVVVTKNKNEKYHIDFPVFGFNPYYHEFKEQKRSKTSFKRQLKQTREGMLSLRLILESGSSFDRSLILKGLDNAYKDCFVDDKSGSMKEYKAKRRKVKKAKWQGKKEMDQDFDFSLFKKGRLKLDSLKIKEENGKLNIQFQAHFSNDSNKKINGTIKTEQLFKKQRKKRNLVERQPLLEKALQYVDKREKVNILPMTYNNWWNEVSVVTSRYRGSVKTVAIPRPEEGKSIVVQETPRGQKIYEYEKWSRERVIIKEYSVYQSVNENYDKEESDLFVRKAESGIPADQDPKRVVKNHEPVAVFMNKYPVNHVKLKPVFFQPSNHPEAAKQRLDLEPNFGEIGYKSIPSDANKDVGAPTQGSIYCKQRGRTYVKTIGSDNAGYQLHFVRGKRLLMDIKPNQKKVKTRTSKKTYKALIKLSKEWPEKNLAVERGELTSDEALNWGVQQAKKAGIKVDNKKELSFENFEKQVYTKEYADQLDVNPSDLRTLGKTESIKKVKSLTGDMRSKMIGLKDMWKSQKKEYDAKEYDSSEERKKARDEFTMASLQALLKRVRPIFEEHGMKMPEGYDGEKIMKTREIVEKKGDLKGSKSPEEDQEEIKKTSEPADIKDFLGDLSDRISRIYGSEIEDEFFDRAGPKRIEHDLNKLKIDDKGYPALRSFSKKRGPAEQVRYRKDSLEFYGGKSGDFKDSSSVSVDGSFLDVVQFESAVATLPFHKEYRTSLYFAGTDWSRSSGTGGSAYFMYPEFLKVELQVLNETEISRPGASVQVYKVKAFFKGDWELPAFLTRKSKLKYDFKSGNGYAYLYVQKKAPHHLMHIELKDREIPFYHFEQE